MKKVIFIRIFVLFLRCDCTLCENQAHHMIVPSRCKIVPEDESQEGESTCQLIASKHYFSHGRQAWAFISDDILFYQENVFDALWFFSLVIDIALTLLSMVLHWGSISRFLGRSIMQAFLHCKYFWWQLKLSEAVIQNQSIKIDVLQESSLQCTYWSSRSLRRKLRQPKSLFRMEQKSLLVRTK